MLSHRKVIFPLEGTPKPTLFCLKVTLSYTEGDIIPPDAMHLKVILFRLKVMTSRLKVVTSRLKVMTSRLKVVF